MKATGEKLELGRAEALTLLQAHQATLAPYVETAADNRDIETASAPAPVKAKKAPVKAKNAPVKAKNAPVKAKNAPAKKATAKKG